MGFDGFEHAKFHRLFAAANPRAQRLGITGGENIMPVEFRCAQNGLAVSKANMPSVVAGKQLPNGVTGFDRRSASLILTQENKNLEEKENGKQPTV